MTRRHLVLAVVAGGLAFVAPAPAHATDIEVTTFSDVVADDGVCSLREAIIAANTNTASGDQTGKCLAGTATDIITLHAGTYTLNIAGAGEDDAATGDLDIRSNLTIQGMGTAPDQTVIDGADIDRVFDIVSASELSFDVVLTNVSISGGNTPAGYTQDGGAVRLSAPAMYAINLTLNQCRLIDNTSGASGGGVYYGNSKGTLTISNSTIANNAAAIDGGGIREAYGKLAMDRTVISNNSVSGNGGGLALYNVKQAEVLNSSITDNEALGTYSSGGGIENAGGVMTIANSSIDRNVANVDGGGIRNFGTLAIINSTIADNIAQTGMGGIYNSGALTATNVTVSGNKDKKKLGGIVNYTFAPGATTLQNSIVFGNLGTDFFGPFASNGHNLVGTMGTCTGPPSCQVISGQEDHFKILSADLGGFVASLQAGQSYFPLLDTSPAIDAGDTGAAVQALLAGVDQLGHPRNDAAYDIGAVERYWCGDGIMRAGKEECDLGANNSDTGACTLQCKSATCGDNFVRTGVEECDAGAANSDTAPDACRTTCKAHFCGDGVRDSNEGCEPVLTGKCAAGCKLPTCGDGVLEPGEACDDGNASNTDGCLATCVLAVCGDSFVQAGVEECDSGVGTGNAVCTGQCKNVVAAGTPGGETTEPAPAPAEPSGGSAAPVVEAGPAGETGGGCSLIIPALEG